MGQEAGSPDEGHHRPPLPPRPSTSASIDQTGLSAQATTAVTHLDIQTVSFPDGSRGTFSATPGHKTAPSPINSGPTSPRRLASFTGHTDDEDNASVTSFAPTLRPAADIASLLTSELNKRSPAWNHLRSQSTTVLPFEKSQLAADDKLANFEEEFNELPDEAPDVSDDERLSVWKSKLKHYMILSSAGKPIWSRHGDLSLINSSIGVFQTIISFFEEDAKNPLQGFTAGNTRFLVTTQGPLYFVAISKLGESDTQLRVQLEALYMQILSTLTLPKLTHIFKNRPSSDLRKPLHGTETLLSSLADNFTKGSPSALLTSLECLKLRKSHRQTITNTFLKLRTDTLLFGLIVSGGKLVSVIRPRQHSLHPSDLQLIFNMLFESEGIKAGGGENWIPLCLPAFNNRGYLYMYVSFFEDDKPVESPASNTSKSFQNEVALVLISTDRESFFSLKQMRDNVVQQLAKNGSLALIRSATRVGRPKISEIAPGSPICHFLFKSRHNVQFCMSSFEPPFDDLVVRRRLMNVYHMLHSSVHTKFSHSKVLHCVEEDATSLAWVTPIFEFYCVAGPNTSRASITQGANKIVQWAKKEEERVFIIGGGVF